MQEQRVKAILVLEDGRVFEGISFGAVGETFGEIVFNTSMSGYQEILTDPSYAGQIVTMTYPLIGNYGVNSEDVLSNGPGDPASMKETIEEIRKLAQSKTPIFGICLGHQLLGEAFGGKTYKLKFGHRGGNQPIKDLTTGKIEIASHNHGFAVDADSLPADIEVTHINLNDHTVAGLRHKTLPIFSVQYHPESAPGPHDSEYLFVRFIDAMKRTDEK